MGDHARREMIVRIVKAVRQNPAYRSFADRQLQPPIGFTIGGCFFSHAASQQSFMLIYQRRAGALAVLFLVSACAGTQTSKPVAANPTVLATATPTPDTPKYWSLSIAPGTITYRVSRSAAITEEGPGNRSESSTNSTHESITLRPSGDTIAFTAVVDSFLTPTLSAPSPLQAAQLPLKLAGFLLGDSLVIFTDSAFSGCNPVSTALVTDLHLLVVALPPVLSSTSSWRDSTTLTGCQGSLLIRSRVTHSYKVVGESTYDTIPVLLVERTDTIRAEGEGSQQQHRLVLNAQGVGSTTYYLDSSRHPVRVSTHQDVIVTITTSGKSRHFRQNTRQEFTLVR